MNVSQSRDFPDWLGPMLVKELRQGLKARAFELTFIALQVVLVLVVSYHALLYARHGAKFDPDGLNGIFWMIVSVQLLVVTPLRALGGLTNERKANTLELIFMTGLSSWRIAWGKWASLFFQSLLFVLAVLPFAVLRYFFGGVNLADDLIALGGILLASAVFSAFTLAVSGLPTFARVGAIGILGLAGMSFLPAMLIGVFFRSAGMMSMPGSGISFTSVWLLGIFNALLLCMGALELGASTIAPVAENHALRQRLIVLCAWLPVPLLKALHVHEAAIVGQLIFFAVLGCAVSWLHLGTMPPAMRVHLDSFSRRGRVGFFGAMALQPGWPSAVVFLGIVELLLAVSARWAFSDVKDAMVFMTVVLMVGASLMTAPLIWRIFRIRAKYPLVHHTLFLIGCAALALSLSSLSSTGERLGDYPITALLPPFGFFAMLTGNSLGSDYEIWFTMGVGMFLVCGLMLLFLAREYWVKMRQHARDIQQSAKAPRVVAEVAA